MEEKFCSKCKNTKPKTKEFWHKSNQTKDGLQGFCKICRNEHKKTYRDNNKSWINEQAKKYYQNTIEERHTYHREYRTRETTKTRLKKWFEENKMERKEYILHWTKEKYQNDPMYRLHHCFSSNLRDSLEQKGIVKNRKCFEIVGYTRDILKQHLEQQFDKNMNWENYGKYWHIDHKKPKSSFIFSSYDDEEFKKCWSLENLRPLEAKENLRKGAKIMENL